MQRIKEWLEKHPAVRNFLLYNIIGAVAVALDGGILVLLKELGLNLYVANFISVNAGLTCSFLLNSHFNFKMTNKLLQRGVKFFLVGYCGLLLSMLIMYVGVDVKGVYYVVVKVISIVVVGLFQFTMNKFVTFGKKTR